LQLVPAIAHALTGRAAPRQRRIATDDILRDWDGGISGNRYSGGAGTASRRVWWLGILHVLMLARSLLGARIGLSSGIVSLVVLMRQSDRRGDAGCVEVVVVELGVGGIGGGVIIIVAHVRCMLVGRLPGTGTTGGATGPATFAARPEALRAT
jgi:hypothetical protein